MVKRKLTKGDNIMKTLFPVDALLAIKTIIEFDSEVLNWEE